MIAEGTKNRVERDKWLCLQGLFNLRPAKCGKPKGEQKLGFLTQWLFDANSCSCSLESLDSDPAQIHLCGKQLPSERKGSLTQWIFRSDDCQCARTGTALGSFIRSSKWRLQSMPYIARLDNLEILNITGTRISGKGLMELSRNKNLKILRAADCGQLTPKAVLTFRSLRPDCRVSTELPY